MFLSALFLIYHSHFPSGRRSYRCLFFLFCTLASPFFSPLSLFFALYIFPSVLFLSTLFLIYHSPLPSGTRSYRCHRRTHGCRGQGRDVVEWRGEMWRGVAGHQRNKRHETLERGRGKKKSLHNNNIFPLRHERKVYCATSFFFFPSPCPRFAFEVTHLSYVPHGKKRGKITITTTTEKLA